MKTNAMGKKEGGEGNLVVLMAKECKSKNEEIKCIDMVIVLV